MRSVPRPWTTRTPSLGLDDTSRGLAVFLSVASIAVSAMWLTVDVVSNEGQLREIQGWVLIPQIALTAALFVLSYATGARSLVVLGALLVVVIMEEYFHIFTPLASDLERRLGARNEVPWQLFVVAPVALAAFGLTYWGAPRFMKRTLRIIGLFLLVAWLFGGLINIAGRQLDSRPLQLLEEFGEAVGFSMAAGYTIAVASSAIRQRRAATSEGSM